LRAFVNNNDLHETVELSLLNKVLIILKFYLALHCPEGQCELSALGEVKEIINYYFKGCLVQMLNSLSFFTHL